MDARKSRRTPPPMAAGVATVTAHGTSAEHYRLLLRVYAAENLRGVSSHGTYCKVYVGNVDMAASRKGRQSFKKFLLATSLASSHSSSASTPSSSFSSSTGSASPDVRASETLSPTRSQPETAHSTSHHRGLRNIRGIDTSGTRVREFKTQVHKFSRTNPVWNEKFEVPGVNAASDLVSIRVKSARLMSSPAVGACCFPLRDVVEDETVDRWIHLLDGKKDAGRIRVQLRLVRIEPPALSSSVKDRKDSRAHRHRSSRSAKSHASSSNDPATDDDGTTSTRIGRASSKRSSRMTKSNNNNSGNSDSDSSLSRTRLSGSVSPVAKAPATLNPEVGWRQSSRADADANGEVATATQQQNQDEALDPTETATSPIDLEHVSETSTASTSSRSSQSELSQRGVRSNQSTTAAAAATTSSGMTTSITSTRTSSSGGLYADLNEFTDDDDVDEDDNNAQPTRRNGGALASYDSFLRVRDRGTMLSEIGSMRLHGSFVGSLHLYNRNSIATSTPSRTTMVMTEAEIAALSRESALAVRPSSRRRHPTNQDSNDDRLSGPFEDGDTASDEDEDDEDDEYLEPETEGPRIPWNSTITRLLARKSMNILFDEEEEDDEDDNDFGGGGDDDDDSDASRALLEVVPIMDFPGTPHDIDDIDCA